MADTRPDLLDRLTNLGGIADVLAVSELDGPTRRLSLLQVARDCEEAASAARLLAETEAADAATGVSGRE
jgi:hypothetical protein